MNANPIAIAMTMYVSVRKKSDKLTKRIDDMNEIVKRAFITLLHSLHKTDSDSVTQTTTESSSNGACLVTGE